MSTFRFADYNPKAMSVPAYLRTSSGTLEVGVVGIDEEGNPVDGRGPLRDDGRQVPLKGWAHSLAYSYNDGAVLIPVKGSRV